MWGNLVNIKETDVQKLKSMCFCTLNVNIYFTSDIFSVLNSSDLMSKQDSWVQRVCLYIYMCVCVSYRWGCRAESAGRCWRPPARLHTSSSRRVAELAPTDCPWTPSAPSHGSAPAGHPVTHTHTNISLTSVSSGMFKFEVFGGWISYSDTEFGGNRNLKGNISVDEVRVVQSVQGPLFHRLEAEINQSETKSPVLIWDANMSSCPALQLSWDS